MAVKDDLRVFADTIDNVLDESVSWRQEKDPNANGLDAYRFEFTGYNKREATLGFDYEDSEEVFTLYLSPEVRPNTVARLREDLEPLEKFEGKYEQREEVGMEFFGGDDLGLKLTFPTIGQSYVTEAIGLVRDYLQPPSEES